MHLTARVDAPGHIVRTSGNRLVLGAAAGGGTADDALPLLTEDLRVAGFDVDATDGIRQAIWHKLWGNMAFNPVSLVTRSTVDRIIEDPQAVDFVAACMHEAQALGDSLRLHLPSSPAERIALTRTHGRFRTSMHQDAAAGRPVELDALLGSVHRLGQAAGVPTPNLAALLGPSRLHAEAHGLLPARS